MERIVQGVETDRNGAVCAYWVCNGHPLASMSDRGRGLEWTRVEARGRETGRRNILHVIDRERAGQVRGVPVLAPVLDGAEAAGPVYRGGRSMRRSCSARFSVFVESAYCSRRAAFRGDDPPDQL